MGDRHRYLKHEGELDRSEECERSVFGAVLLNPAALDEARAVIGNDASWGDHRHRVLWRALLDMRDAGIAIDFATIVAHLNRTPGLLESAGGREYIADHSSVVPTSANVAHYAKLARDASIRRETVDFARAIGASARGGSDVESLAATALAFVNRIDRQSPSTGRSALDVSAMLDNPPPILRELYQGAMVAGTINGLDAAGGTGKTFTSFQMIIALATGRTLLKSFVPKKARRVLWLQGEDTGDILHIRLQKILDQYQLDDDALDLLRENLTIYAGSPFPIVKAQDGVVNTTPEYRWLAGEVKRLQPGAIFIDPRNQYAAIDENDNAHVGAFVGKLRELTELVDDGCAVLVVHHVGKGREAEASSAAGRGASAGRDGQRQGWTLTPLTDSEVTSLGVTDRARYVRLHCVKSNYQARTDDAVILRRAEGGVLVDVDAATLRIDVQNAMLDGCAREIAKHIGDNPKDWTTRDVLRGNECAELRDAVKRACGKHASREYMERAIERGFGMGVLRVEDVGTSTKPRAALREIRTGGSKSCPSEFGKRPIKPNLDRPGEFGQN